MEMTVVGAGVTRGQINKLSEVIARPDDDLHSGNAELAVVLIDHGGEFRDKRFGHVPHAGAIRFAEYLCEATLNVFDLGDIELPMSRPGDGLR
ncbi:hypothetical protein [Paraburkholderia unamae]|uniref:hypothetical protein n=1 Tax=Paraburkholderia unamae TaxID=219649 RepID=UPI001CC3F389|nr:hypothetical protein [Paraburkholderia unamae]